MPQTPIGLGLQSPNFQNQTLPLDEDDDDRDENNRDMKLNGLISNSIKLLMNLYDWLYLAKNLHIIISVSPNRRWEISPLDDSRNDPGTEDDPSEVEIHQTRVLRRLAEGVIASSLGAYFGQQVDTTLLVLSFWSGIEWRAYVPESPWRSPLQTARLDLCELCRKRAKYISTPMTGKTAPTAEFSRKIVPSETKKKPLHKVWTPGTFEYAPCDESIECGTETGATHR